MNKFKLALTIVTFCSASATNAAPKSVNDILHGQKRENANQSKYLVAFGKVLARRSGAGWTTFEYRGGRVVSEKSPEGIVGAYLYDHNGRLEEIQYTSGKRVKIKYTENGRVATVSTDRGKIAKFNENVPLIPKGKEKIGDFVLVQESMEVMGDQFCDTGDLESNCQIIVTGPKSGSGGFAGYYPRFPGSGGGGGGGGGGGTGTPYKSHEECKDEVCDDGNRDMNAYCTIAARTPDSNRRCRDKAFEFYSKCLRSCSNGDWSWLDDFNFIW